MSPLKRRRKDLLSGTKNTFLTWPNVKPRLVANVAIVAASPDELIL
jgi:hypothetical protein